MCHYRLVTTLPVAEQTAFAPSLTREHQDAGARWWSLDVHAHSPASFDYGGLEGMKSDEAKPSFKGWICAYMNAGLDGIVVTDHNSHEGIDQARKALAELRQDDLALRPFVIFPGVEITAAGGFHILGVFDPASSAEVVNNVLVLCQYAGTRGNSDQTANKTVADVAAIIVAQGGICIPAHADQDRGVFAMDSRDLEFISKSSSISAVEVIDDSKVGKAAGFGWVPVLGSDAHHLTKDGCPEGREAKAPGTHLTLIKAETLDLEGVRLALTDPVESVRRSRSGYSDPNHTEHGYINRIEVVRGGVTENYRFGPWMNCLIGGRGVGKSTVIELLRLALGRSHELQGSVAKDLRRFSPSSERTEHWWDDDTRIVVEYTRDSRLLRVTWSGHDPENATLEIREGKAWKTQSGRAFDRVPIRVFSQKQIYQLATSPQSFLAMLDDMPSMLKSEWAEEYEELQLKVKGERNNLRQVLTETEKADRIRGQLEEVQGRLRDLTELSATEQYQELLATEVRIREAATVEQQAENIEHNLAAQASALYNAESDALRVPEYVGRAASFATAAGFLEQAAASLRTGRTSWQTGATHNSWQARIHELNTWLLEQGGLSNMPAEQMQSLRRQDAELKAELSKVENFEQRRSQQQAVIDRLMEQLKEKRNELFVRRREYTRGLRSPDSLTRVNVYQEGSVAGIGDQLRNLLNCPESFESAFINDGIAATLLKQMPKDPRFPAEVQKFKESLIELVENGANSEIGRSLRVDARFYGRLAIAETFDLVTNIMLWFPEDLVEVLYRADKKGFTPVDRGSPGQKTAALLTVILQMGTDPLLLDQPEDDLENKLIKRLAVETLKNIKTSRQLIVSTHNANIVVTSAAENILVLEHGESLPRVGAEGTLQVEEVKANVCEILEGGEDAIKTRYRRLIGPANG